MNREEAFKYFNYLHQYVTTKDGIEAYQIALSVLRGPQPDPITGLVPCGCGGVVEQTDFHDGFFPHSKVECLECGIEIMRAGYTIAEAHDMAKIGWNISHGYVAKRGPWVKTADRLPTEADADSELMIMAWHIYFGYEAVAYGSVIDEPERFTYWMPIPPLPEVEG